MTKKQQEELTNYLDLSTKRFKNNYHFTFCFGICDFGDDLDEAKDNFNELVLESEVIYYQTAMTILSENDDSLKYSLELAIELGYETNNINSELLATLLIQDLLNEEFLDWEEIEEILK